MEWHDVKDHAGILLEGIRARQERGGATHYGNCSPGEKPWVGERGGRDAEKRQKERYEEKLSTL